MTRGTTVAGTGPASVAYPNSTNGVPRPLGRIVAEHDAVRVEVVQLLQRGRAFSLIPSVVAEGGFLEARHAPGGLAAQDRPGGVVAFDQDRLVSWCVPGSRDEPDAARDLVVSSITVRSMFAGNAHSGTV
jgi:hypothetical protein